MNSERLYTLFKDVIETIPEIKSFYLIDPYETNDDGSPLEYPKVILLKPLQSVCDGSKLHSEWNLTMNIVNVYNQTASTTMQKVEKELEVIDYCESLWIEIWNKLGSNRPRSFNYMTIHESNSDMYSGIEVSFQMTLGMNMCSALGATGGTGGGGV